MRTKKCLSSPLEVQRPEEGAPGQSDSQWDKSRGLHGILAVELTGLKGDWETERRHWRGRETRRGSQVTAALRMSISAWGSGVLTEWVNLLCSSGVLPGWGVKNWRRPHPQVSWFSGERRQPSWTSGGQHGGPLAEERDIASWPFLHTLTLSVPPPPDLRVGISNQVTKLSPTWVWCEF